MSAELVRTVDTKELRILGSIIVRVSFDHLIYAYGPYSAVIRTPHFRRGKNEKRKAADDCHSRSEVFSKERLRSAF